VIRVRALEACDLDDAERLHKDAFGAEAWDRKAIGEILAMPRTRGMIAFDAACQTDDPLGFALFLVVAQDAELITLAVRHGARRRGVGQRLVETFLAFAIADGATSALLEVAEDNAAAQALYGKLGFVGTGRRKDYYERPGNRRVAARLLRRAVP
jgi:ribosomal-protein-alanine N-acetyltransferase